VFEDIVSDKCYLVCKACGFIEGPFPLGTLFAGPAGQLPCRKCGEKRVNKNIEVYGNVKVMKFVPQDDLTLDELITKCGQAANRKGWEIKWDGTARESFPTSVMLTAHELLDAIDKGWRDDNRAKAFEELGDSLVRHFHICHDLNVPMATILRRIMAENEKRPYKHGRKIL